MLALEQKQVKESLLWNNFHIWLLRPLMERWNYFKGFCILFPPGPAQQEDTTTACMKARRLEGSDKAAGPEAKLWHPCITDH
jgi:hypothetical protein